MEFNSKREPTEMTEFQAQAHVWNQTFNFINSMTLKCAVELGIPDIIDNHGRPITLPDLVSTLGIPQARASSLRRLMRILTHSGFFAQQKMDPSSDDEEGESEEYVLTPPSRLLLKGNLVSMCPLVLLMVDPVMTQQFNCLSKWFHSDIPISPFEMQHGRPCWDYTLHDPEFNRLMNEAMASDAPIVTGKIIEKCKNTFERYMSIVDVAGGIGILAKGIANAFPRLEVTVLDLPQVVGGLEATKNLKYLAGDMFKYIPPTDIILLKWILHDWDDEHCLNILRRCKEAITANGNHERKLIVIEVVIGEEQKEDDKWNSMGLFCDMMVMATLNGKERSRKEWAKLFLDSGFSEFKITPLIGSRCLIEVDP